MVMPRSTAAAAHLGHLFVDSLPMADSNDTKRTARTIDIVNDAEAPYSISPQSFEVPTKWITPRRILGERPQCVADATLQFGMEATDDLGGRRAKDDPVTSHLSASLTRLLERFAEHLLQ
jgi:hypothetical protein